MTNFKAIEDYRRLVLELGELVPDSCAHTLAGVSRQRWNELKTKRRVAVIEFYGEYFIKLRDIETRSTQPGRRGWLYHYLRGKL